MPRDLPFSLKQCESDVVGVNAESTSVNELNGSISQCSELLVCCGAENLLTLDSGEYEHNTKFATH